MVRTALCKTPCRLAEGFDALKAVDLEKVLVELREELRRIDDSIVALENLASSNGANKRVALRPGWSKHASAGN